jgi:hypothetical protein
MDLARFTASIRSNWYKSNLNAGDFETAVDAIQPSARAMKCGQQSPALGGLDASRRQF